MRKNQRNLLLLGGALSSYTFDLFESIATLAAVDVRFVHSPLDGLPSFQHESTKNRASNSLCWQDAALWRISKFIRDPPPDAVFVYGNRPRARMMAALASLPSKTPLFYAADTNICDLAQQPARTFARHIGCVPMVRRATAAMSLGLTNQLAMRALGFQRIVDLPVYAVDFAALDTAAGVSGAANGSSGADSEIVVLIVARLTPVKNLPGFVGALARDSKLTRRMRLIIAGEGPDRSALEEIQRCQPNLRMDLLGPVDRRGIGKLLRRADVLLLPSLLEPWGIVVVEALGMGLPVVATPAVGAAVSLAGYTGAVLLSDSAEPASIVTTMHRFFDQRTRLTAAARECVPHIRKHYDRLAVAKETIRLVYGDRCNE
jgi:glycosyltransferase involved in cell wall biosynthesis